MPDGGGRSVLGPTATPRYYLVWRSLLERLRLRAKAMIAPMPPMMNIGIPARLKPRVIFSRRLGGLAVRPLMMWPAVWMAGRARSMTVELIFSSMACAYRTYCGCLLLRHRLFRVILPKLGLVLPS